MSIDFSSDGGFETEEPLVATSLLREDEGEYSLRPQTLSEYIGQQKAKGNLSIFIEAAKMRKEPLDHVLLHGPPGLGKTTLSGIIANEMGVNIRITSGPAIEKPGDLAALLTNLHLPNFFKGGIYQGKGKTVCVPGLNCYSCPGAAGACPIGAFQAVVGSSKFRFSYYITGILILLGVLLGRFICGFLCPFGWFQELLHKIPTKKLSTKRLKPLTYLKYAVLLVMVFLLPAFLVNDVGMGDPFFCKYLCPQGVLEGAIPLSLANSGIRAALGKLFTWKFSILLSVIALSVLFYRPFCKWLCPLGAFYALFNRVSLFQMKVDKNKCVSCGKCARACKMDVDVTKTPNHTECIRCGMCIRACPTKAVCFRYGFGDGKDKAKAAETLQTNNTNREE